MAGSVNKVILIGNLGRDPEARTMPSGDRVVSFSVATTESWRDKNTGERIDRTEWHNVSIFNDNLGKIAEQYCRKGSKVYLEGQLQTREYTDKEGNQRKATEVVLQRFRGELTLLDSKSSGRGESDYDAVGSNEATAAYRQWNAHQSIAAASRAANFPSSWTTIFPSSQLKARYCNDLLFAIAPPYRGLIKILRPKIINVVLFNEPKANQLSTLVDNRCCRHSCRH
jgi:single-strand DNA-binding protein